MCEENARLALNFEVSRSLLHQAHALREWAL
jgi:hypothetical protein